MFEKFFLLLFQSAHRHKKWVIGFVFLATAAAGIGLFFVRYDGNIDMMLPPDKEIMRSMDFLRDSSFSDKVIISLALTDPARDKGDLFRAADQLADSLKPPLFTKVTTGFSLSNAMEEFSILRYAPEVLGESDLPLIDRQLTEKNVSRKMGEIYRQSLRPESIFISSMSGEDPIGIKLLLMEKLRALPASMGFDVAIEDGHFVSRDGRHAMVIAQTTVPMMESERSKLLIATLQSRLKELPPYVSADIIGGHLHTVTNEKVIIRDITVASIVASVAFFLLFLLAFRDLRALLVFVLPFIAVIWTVVITALVEQRLSYLVIGFGTAIVGISDVGLIVYTALKHGADTSQTAKLAKLVCIDAFTTIFSFIVLFFSVIRGYHQLALFAVICLMLGLLFALFVLPLALSGIRPIPEPEHTVAERVVKIPFPTRLTIAAWALPTLALLVLSFSIRFDSDVKKLDGSGKEIARAEERFHDVWGGRTNQALFVAIGTTLEEAMEKNDRVYRAAIQAVGSADFTSLALFWPSDRTRKENRERWDAFWRDGRETRLKELIRRTSGAYGFSDGAFAPFFDGLYARKDAGPTDGGVISRLKERFVMQKNGEFRIVSFFPDKQSFIDSLKEVTKENPGTFIVSGRQMSSAISAVTMKEIVILAPLAALFNIVLTWFFFRNWRETLIALAPLLTGIVWLLGILSFFHIPLNVVNIVAGIIASGVIVDYGIGITYESRRNMNFGSATATSLSAASNVIGAGALLFAKHPALHSTGVAMVICMVTGYLSAIIVIPALCRLIGPVTEHSEP